MHDLVGDKGGEGSGSSSNPIANSIRDIQDAMKNREISEQIRPVDTQSLSNIQKMKIRQRSEVMARQFFPDKDDNFIEQQVKQFQESLNIDDGVGFSRGFEGNRGLYDSSTFGQMGKGKGRYQELDDNIDFPDVDLGQHMSDYFDNDNLTGDGLNYLENFKKQLTLAHVQESAEAYTMLAQSQDNPYMNAPNKFQIGMQLRESGDLNKAILAFEACVQENRDNSDAWYLLGLSHAECDDDVRAISALASAVRADPNNLDALLELGVSYTNELHKINALVYLKSWLNQHPVYSSISQPNSSSTFNFFALHAEVMEMFNQAVSMNPNDAQLYTVLGVLNHLVDEYDEAVAAFHKAATLNPKNHSYWNKLGATQANNRQSDKAVEAYRKALKLKPNYIRAWVNLGIAYSNQQEHVDAVKFFLRALSMCPRIEHVWTYLAFAFHCMKREDLVEMCNEKNVELFRREFQF
jgi:tetratricopeptide (TPR) repeat protein